jgi:hypothetical protein
MIRAGRSLGEITEGERRTLERYLRDTRYLLDPVGWHRDVLDGALWGKQREIARAIRDHRLVAVHSAQDVGKSYVAAVITCWWVVTHRVGDAFVITSAPTQKQVEAVLWREIRRIHAAADLPGTITGTEWKIGGELVAMGRKPADYAQGAFQGIHAPHVLLILDEAAGVHQDIWTQARTQMANEGSAMLVIGNPDDPASEFARVCAPGSPWRVIHIDGLGSPNFTGEEIPEKIARQLISPAWERDMAHRFGEGSPIYCSKVRGLFPEESEDALIPLAQIRAAQDRFENAPAKAETLGVDVARFGNNETVIVARAGGIAWIVSRARKEDTMRTVGRIKLAREELSASTVIVDVIGVGGGVVDRLKEDRVPVTPFIAGEAAKDPARFANAKAEANWRLRERFEDGEITICRDEDLLAQLSGIRYGIDSSQRIRIESKEDARSRGVASPDIADALALCFSDLAVPYITPDFSINLELYRPNPWAGAGGSTLGQPFPF